MGKLLSIQPVAAARVQHHHTQHLLRANRHGARGRKALAFVLSERRRGCQVIGGERSTFLQGAQGER